ncbi:NAD-dependent epimerase/dehydratase family protein [Streptomyces fuscichromogenes]|uniref:NAD-dependent epimerase/dehydratase family protein n=1 Tax=Streptomyces fuscichromogenes TaxID=1324013 RepID=UPI00382251A3
MAHVLVTGGTGFLGSHAIARLLASGHKVTTTLRSLKRRPDVEKMLSVAEAPGREGVSYVKADLASDTGWDRDVADLHLKAMTSPAAAGQRYLALAGEPVSFGQIALALRSRLGEAAAKAPTRSAPAWLLRLLSTVSPQLRETVPQLGVVRRASNAKAREQLGWAPRPNEESVVASARSLVRLGLLAD